MWDAHFSPQEASNKANFLLKCWKAHTILGTFLFKILISQHMHSAGWWGWLCYSALLRSTVGPIGPGEDASSMCTKGSPVGTIVKWENHSETCPSPHWILHIMDFPLIQQPLAGLQPPGTQMCSSSSSAVPSTCLRGSSPGWRKEKEIEELNLLINHDRKLYTLFPLSLLVRGNHMTPPSCKGIWKM